MRSLKCLTYVLCLGAVALAFTSVQGTDAIHPDEPRRVELERALVSFASWAKRYTTKSGAVAGPRAVEEGIALARQRRAALRELIQLDPASALEASIPNAVRQRLPEAITNELETLIDGTGDLFVACVIPTKGTQQPATIQRSVNLEGHPYHAYVYGWRLREKTELKIPLHGVAIDDVLALDESVQGSLAGPFQKRVNQPLAAPFPVKKVLVLRVDFSDLPGDPHFPLMPASTAESAQTMLDTQVRPYYRNSSYGRADVAFTVSTNVYRLPQTAANYASMGSTDALYNQAEAAASGDYAKTDYDVIVVLFSFLGAFPNSQIQFGGMTLLGQGKVWVNGELDFRVVAHELGHTYGLDHANAWETNDGDPISDKGASVEYGDVFDTMALNWGDDQRTDFNPWYKYLLNWIGDDQVQTITTNGIYRVYRFDNPSATGTLALRIVKNAERNYWIGCRRNFTENPTMSHGAYVIWGYNYARQSDLLRLGHTPNDSRDAALPIGAALTDAEASLRIMPVADGGTSPHEYIDVEVIFAPTLRMSTLANQIVLSWPASATNFNLETRSDLSAAGAWTSVAGEPVLVGRSFVFTNQLESSAAFYRLHRR